MSILALGISGGFISFLSTSAGALFALFTTRRKAGAHGNRFSLPIDFALGVMVSASAFSLIGPAAISVQSAGKSLGLVAISTLAGGLAVYGLKLYMDRLKPRALGHQAPGLPPRFMLAAVLMLHNFPEGLASGAAVAGLGWQGSIGILGAISLQNIPEGALMVFCLASMGWGIRSSFLGGIASGLVELAGGILAGLLLGLTQAALPFLLALAGGAMMASVGMELLEEKKEIWQRIFSPQFRSGFLLLVAFQLLQFWT